MNITYYLDLMQPYNETQSCELYKLFSISQHHKIVSWTQVTVSLIGNAFLIFAWIFLGIIPKVEIIIKKLIYYSYAFIFIHNFFTAFTQAMIQINYSFKSPCNLFPAWSCMILRIPQLYCFVGLVMTYVVIVFDRAFSTLKPIFYEANGSKALPFYGIFILLTPIFLGTPFIIESPLYPYRPYCTITNDSSATNVNYLFRILLILTFLSVITLCFLLFLNYRSLQRNTHNFNVNSHYQFKTNLLAIKFSFVSTTFTLFVNFGFLLANTFIRIFVTNVDRITLHAYLEFTYFVPIHAFTSAFVMLFFAIRQKNLSVKVVDADPVNEHFQVLQDLWK